MGKALMVFAVIVAAFALGVLPTPAADGFARKISLPEPDKKGGKPLMEALSLRRSNRDFDSRKLDMAELGNLLWATWGANRPEGRRTAPTARNTQNVGVCVAMEDGVWWYDGVRHELEMALDMDVREKLGGAPVTLIYFAPADDPAAGMHVGSLYQNAGLYCASAGLANVVKMTGANALDDVLDLPKGYKVFVIQAIGYPR